MSTMLSPRHRVHVLAGDAAESWTGSRFDPGEWAEFDLSCASGLPADTESRVEGALEVALIGPDVAEPLAAARDLRRRRPSTQIVFLVPGERLARFEQMLPFVPELAGSRAVDTAFPASELKRIVAVAAAAARQSREIRGLFGSINAQFAAAAEGAGPVEAPHAVRQHRHLVLAERYLSAILAHVPDALVATDLDGAIVAWNDAATRLFGLTWDQAAGRYISDVFSEASRDGVLSLRRRVALGETLSAHEAEISLPSGPATTVEIDAAPILGPDGVIEGISLVARDITRRKQLEEQQKLLIRELHHRVKNTLATVQAVLGLSLRSTTSVEEFYHSFSGRIVSLSHTHDLLTIHDRQKASLRSLLKAELEPYDDDSGRIRLEGPEVELSSALALPISMAIHELTTNAAKYGCLSVLGGCLTARWEVVTMQDAPMLRLEWVEREGPPVQPPAKQGFGSRLLKRVLSDRLGAVADLAFDAGGVRFSLQTPLQ